MVGSGARDLETQTANEPVDLDYNVNIISINGSTKEKDIKEFLYKFKRADSVLIGNCYGLDEEDGN